MLDELYLEIRDKWNELRLKNADPEILKFFVHLLDKISGVERNESERVNQMDPG